MIKTAEQYRQIILDLVKSRIDPWSAAEIWSEINQTNDPFVYPKALRDDIVNGTFLWEGWGEQKRKLNAVHFFHGEVDKVNNVLHFWLNDMFVVKTGEGYWTTPENSHRRARDMMGLYINIIKEQEADLAENGGEPGVGGLVELLEVMNGCDNGNARPYSLAELKLVDEFFKKFGGYCG